MTPFDVVVIGSGIVGSCCAYELSLAGLRVAVVDRGHLASGTTAAGEGNLLVSDKRPGPELDLALLSLSRWEALEAELAIPFEFDRKGGLVVAQDADEADALARFAADQRRAGVGAEPVDATGLRRLEPHLSPRIVLGVHYPQDAQLQPVLASAALLRRAKQLGAQLFPDLLVVGIDRSPEGRVAGVRTARQTLATDWVVNAAGPWSAEVAALVGADLPVVPRRGHILVTERCPPLIRHKVYEAGYVGTLVTDEGAAQVSSVVEGTASGTVLLGSSREFVGFDRRQDMTILRRLAQHAVRLFPVLADVRVMRSYVGFRPWVPDHTPVIGEEPGVPGFLHATGHEGAGIGLAAATGLLVHDLVLGRTPRLDLAPFRVDRPTLTRQERSDA